MKKIPQFPIMKISIRIAVIVTILLALIIAMGVAQVGQIIQSNSDIRSYELNAWAYGDKQRQQQVASFTELCLKAGFTDEKEKDFVKRMEQESADDDEYFAIKECAKNHNYGDLYVVIKNADLVLKNTAWPLSLVVPTIK